MRDPLKDQWPIEIQRKPLFRMNFLKEDSDEYLILPTYFNKVDRTLHFFCADLNAYNVQFLLNLLQSEIDEHLQNILEHIKELDIDIITDQITNLEAKITDYLNLKDNWVLDQKSASLKEILTIAIETLFNIQMPCDWYEAGIAYRIFEVLGKSNSRSPLPAPWFYMEPKQEDSRREMSMAFGDNKFLNMFLYRLRDGFYLIPDKVKPEYKRFHINMKQHLFIPLLSLFNKNCPDEFFTSNSILNMDSGNRRSSKEDYLDNACIVIPVYDIYISGVGYGGIQGFYNFYSRKRNIQKDNKFGEAEKILIEKTVIEKRLPDIIDISNYIFLSNLFRIELEDLKVDSFIDCFIEMVKYIQDWETVWVSKKESFRIGEIIDTDITHWWGRKPDKEKVRYGWINHFDENKNELKNAAKGLKEAVGDDRRHLFELPLDSIKFLFDEEEITKYKIDLKQYVIFEFPKVSIMPPSSKDLISIERAFYNKIRDRQIQVFEIVIKQWRDNNYTKKLNLQEGYIEQMSHNLHHVLEGAQQEMRNNLLFLDNADHILDPDKFEQKDSSLVGCYNFLGYLRGRVEFFVDFEMDFKGMYRGSKNEISKAIDNFNYQLIIRKHITHGANTKHNDEKIVKLKDVKIELLNSEEKYKNLIVYDEPLYMFLESYIRNIAKHQAVISKAMNVYVEITDTNSNDNVCISLWEDSEKNSKKEDAVLELTEFYEQWKNLDNLHREIKGRPFADGDNRGISAMECLVNSLVFSGDAKLSVRPVLMPADNRHFRYKVMEREEGQYYIVIDGEEKELTNEQMNRFSMEYQFEMTKLPKEGW